jgi:hypothetical protein
MLRPLAGLLQGLLVLGFSAREAPAAATSDGVALVSCASSRGGRTHCPADTSLGVVLMKTTGEAACLLGKTWGYDDEGIWVSDGCAGEFQLGRRAGPADEAAPPAPPSGTSRKPSPEKPIWGTLDSSAGGFLLGRTELGELTLSGYALVRYINQTPADQTFTDHLGDEHDIDTRNDIQFHRAMLHFKGWLFSQKLRYQITVWTVMSTDQTTLYGFVGYQQNTKFNIYGGINTIGGSRSLFGSHPFWLANDRVMADEFFRPSFSAVLWANGEVLPGLWYHVAAGNNLSQLGINAIQLNRTIATGVSLWWMPTTHEFGPQGAYGDWEHHERAATRFGVSTAQSIEDRQEMALNSPENTQIKLADSLVLFDTGALAPGVTVREVDYRILSVDAGVKYRGMFFQAEGYQRWLDDFKADGPLPVEEIVDNGFYVQAAFFPIKQRLEAYGVTSWIFGDKDAGFETSREYIVGGNYYPFATRTIRINAQVINVKDSPVSSVFGFYVGGQTGTTYSVAASIFF